MTHGGDQGARVAIRLLQDAAERGDIDPWDVDVIAVIDGFLDQLRQTLDLPRQLAALGGSYEQGLAASSEAFLAASVLVALKAEHLEERTLAADEGGVEDGLEAEIDDGADPDGWPARLALPARPTTTPDSRYSSTASPESVSTRPLSAPGALTPSA